MKEQGEYSSGSNPEENPSERNTTVQKELPDNSMEVEERAGECTNSKIKMTLHETGILDEQQEVFLEMEVLDKSPNVQNKDLHVHMDRDPACNSLQPSAEPCNLNEAKKSKGTLLSTALAGEQYNKPDDQHIESDRAGSSSQSSAEPCNPDEAKKSGSTPRSTALAVEQYNEPDRTLYVYKHPSVGSEVMINVVSLTPVEEPQGVGAEGEGCEGPAGIQSGSDEDMAMAPQEEEEEGSDRDLRDSTSSVTAEDIPEYSCDHCDFTTTKKHLHLSHQVLHAIPDMKHLFYCSQCSYTTPQRFNLKTHIKTHFDITKMDPSELYKCTECDYVSMYKYDLQTHSKKHDPDKTFRCFHCDFTSIYRHSLLHHISSKHQGVRPHQCSLCPYSAARKQDLQTHMFKHNKQKRYKCSECEYETTYRQCLKSHANIHKGDTPFKCSRAGCDFSTNSKANLKSHVTRHNKRLPCEACGHEAVSAKKLAEHQCLEAQKQKELNKRISMTEVPEPSRKDDGKLEYRCQECDYVSRNKHSVKRHRQVHDAERDKPDKVHQCKQCNYVTAYKSSLTRHMARHSLVKPFKCGHCDYTAITMTQMHTHIAKHTGIKRYACDLCTYSTANKQHLTNHMSKHSKLRYKCNACGHLTAWKDRMRVHLRQHAQGRILSPSVKSPSSPLSSPGFQVLSTEGAQLFTTDGQVLQVLRVVENDSVQQMEGSETLVVMNQLADRIQEEFMAIAQEEGHVETIGQEEGHEEAISQEESHVEAYSRGTVCQEISQEEVQIGGDGGEKMTRSEQEPRSEGQAEPVSQGDIEEGTLMIVTDHDGSDVHLRLLSAELQSPQPGPAVISKMCNESSITSNAIESGNASSTIMGISGEKI